VAHADKANLEPLQGIDKPDIFFPGIPKTYSTLVDPYYVVSSLRMLHKQCVLPAWPCRQLYEKFS